MNPGELRNRVLIKTKATVLNDERLSTATYSSGEYYWANMTPIGGEVSRERYGVSEAGITMRMRTRPLSAVVVGNMVVFDSINYEIRHVAKYPDTFVALLRAL